MNELGREYQMTPFRPELVAMGVLITARVEGPFGAPVEVCCLLTARGGAMEAARVVEISLAVFRTW